MLRPLKPKLLDLTAVRFLIVGIFNTFAGLLIIFACKGLLGLNDTWSNLIGYACGLLISFALNKNWSFRYQGSSGAALLRFALVILVAYAFNLGLTLTAIHDLGINSYLAQTLGIVPYTITTYLGSRYFAFPKAKTAGSHHASTP